MTDSGLLRQLIRESGYKMKFLAEELCLTPYGFQRKVDNISEFTAGEISKLCAKLGINSSDQMERIFFA